jgi:DNA-binding MarR family transcriptional regulator
MEEKNIKHTVGKQLHDLFREVFQLHTALSSIMDKVHEQAGLSTSQHKIMGALDHIGPGTVPDMAAVLGVSRQFVQTVCNDLLSRGFIEFADNPRHKRSKLAVLTESGRIAFRQARQKENEIIEQAMPGIDPDRATDARELLEWIRKAVQKIPNDP